MIDKFRSWTWTYYNDYFDEKEDSFEKRFVIAGADKSDFDIGVRGNILSIDFEGNEYSGSLHEKYKLPDGVSANDVSSTYEAGVLTVTVKKPKKQLDSCKKIAVK